MKTTYRLLTAGEVVQAGDMCVGTDYLNPVHNTIGLKVESHGGEALFLRPEPQPESKPMEPETINKSLDLTKPVENLKGHPVTIYNANARGVLGQQIHGCTHYTNHDLVFDVSLDVAKTFLRNIPVKHKRKVWVNIYEDIYKGGVYPEKCLADRNASEDRIACKEIEIEFTEGEGL